jgi:hypothetical protein
MALLMHPLLRLMASRPQLLTDHAEAYVELAAVEIGQVSADWTRRVALHAAGLCGLGVAAVLAGVAFMLWAALPASGMQAPWVLIVAPLLPFTVALGCLGWARARGPGAAFEVLRRQLRADLAMLREASA